MKKHIYMITFIVLLCDQAIKQLVIQNAGQFPIEVIPSFFQFNYVQNTGGAWGVLGNATWLLALIGVGAVILLNQYLSKEEKFSKLSLWAYGLFMGGLLGNLIDRLVLRFVVDYLDFTIFGYSFPVFNLADIAIVVGLGLFFIEIVGGEVYEYYRRKRKH